MNERLKQLAEQAGCKVMDGGEWYIPSATGLEKVVYTSGVGLEKFAELIVRECIAQASISNGHGNNQWDKALTFAADNIKKHFGVEE